MKDLSKPDLRQRHATVNPMNSWENREESFVEARKILEAECVIALRKVEKAQAALEKARKRLKDFQPTQCPQCYHPFPVHVLSGGCGVKGCTCAWRKGK